MFAAPKVLRSVLGLRAQTVTEPVARIEPRHDRWVKAAARQRVDPREAICLPDLEGGSEAVPSTSGTNAPMKFAVVHEKRAGGCVMPTASH
jgi:hypothetical protein